MIKNLFFILSIFFLLSCGKSNEYAPPQIHPVVPNQPLSVIIILGDGMGIPQITATWHEHQHLNLQEFPYTGLLLTHTTDKMVTESGAGATAMFTGVKTKYGYQGMDSNGNYLESLYTYLKSRDYKTGIITSSFITDASIAALYSHGTDRYDYEKIALDFYHAFPDITIGGGQDHFDHRSDQINLIDSLSRQGVKLFYDVDGIAGVNTLPSIGFMHPFRPPYLLDGRSDFLQLGSQKALELMGNKPFFLFIESGLIDNAGHDMSIDDQVRETQELDALAGMMKTYAQSKENVLVLVVADHESGALTLLQGDGMQYIPNYAVDEHSGNMVATFAYGPGAENFTGLMDNTDIYYRLLNLIDKNLIP